MELSRDDALAARQWMVTAWTAAPTGTLVAGFESRQEKDIFRLGGIQFDWAHPQLEEGVAIHGVLPNQQMKAAQINDAPEYRIAADRSTTQGLNALHRWRRASSARLMDCYCTLM
ncbi:hypothetical protein [Mesorhizobium sp. CAU 1741]|uniref:hypothetical protein n=1 Tax=Mesorhizobium sp. CAU 1741 TaxID=3140366 RepID=UPI00325AFEEE